MDRIALPVSLVEKKTVMESRWGWSLKLEAE